MKTNELRIVRRLRLNARESLTKMSRKTGIPVSTIYERLKRFEKGVIRKHTCLIDFHKLGYDLRVTILIKADPKKREDLEKFLLGHHHVNMVFRINNGFDYLAEVVFKTMGDVQQFMDALDGRGARSKQEFYVLDELRRESFLTSDAHLDLLQTV